MGKTITQDNVLDIITKEVRIEAQDSQQSLQSFEGRIPPCWLIDIISVPPSLYTKHYLETFS